jgi:hypothetical protein
MDCARHLARKHHIATQVTYLLNLVHGHDEELNKLLIVLCHLNSTCHTAHHNMSASDEKQDFTIQLADTQARSKYKHITITLLTPYLFQSGISWSNF